MGGFVINDRLCEQVEPFIEGGTGSTSESEEQPHFMPDKFESGTQNIVGIYGLNASLKFLKEKGIESIRKHELEMTMEFIKRVKDLPGVRLAGKDVAEGRVAVVSIDFEGSDNAEIGFVLEHEYHISTRVGLHCAPSAHKTLGTFPQGTVRFSFGYATTLEQIEYAADAIKRTLESME
jgi:Selenocysteine lyase